MIVTAYNTLYAGEDYSLYVDLGTVLNAEVKHGSMALPIDANTKHV